MSKRSWSKSLLAVTLFAGASALFSPACSTQSVGQRCSTTNGNKDCDVDLVCIKASSLRNGADGVARCCPESGNSVEACRRGTPKQDDTVGIGGSSAGGSTGTDGGGLEGVDVACSYNSNCKTGLECSPLGTCQEPCTTPSDCTNVDYTCSPQGFCQAECLQDRDCGDATLPFCSTHKKCVACVEDANCASGTCLDTNVCQ